ncbi:uncharacterized protein M421DRAFT_381010 [Didymella exigua CBS 183.55]|uniref:Uncharacterized protein n=1 Tax=Didymella exigua CBS 183.55 TaxID=1150837 RepID=A0A6A5RR57_9PLEO|nr:uncharacterized protein M421DRAFT_381010 [Didymella exigua CBS 183.55]KAF1929933.1 hypothetical protein M421DRAFT_381010 [Didymella exigua CBS 183.55]
MNRARDLANESPWLREDLSLTRLSVPAACDRSRLERVMVHAPVASRDETAMVTAPRTNCQRQPTHFGLNAGGTPRECECVDPTRLEVATSRLLISRRSLYTFTFLSGCRSFFTKCGRRLGQWLQLQLRAWYQKLGEQQRSSPLQRPMLGVTFACLAWTRYLATILKHHTIG